MADTNEKGTDLTDAEINEIAKEKGVSAVKHTFTDPRDRETLAPWMALGLILHDLYGYSYQAVCDKIRKGKGSDTLAKAGISPAGKRLREKIAELSDNPEKMAKLWIQATSLDVTADFILALEWAKEARDHRAVHAMTKDLLAIAGVSAEEKKQNAGPTTVHIHLESPSLDTPVVDTSYEILEDD